MGRNRIEVSPHGEQWSVKREGTNRPLDTYKDRETAIRKARELAKQEEAELVIKGRDESEVTEAGGTGPSDELIH